jgi:transposase
MPTRPRRPRDKAKVEGAVLIVERWILARLRNQRFFSLAELNAAIRSLINELNARLMRKLGASRREFFENIDQPALMALPTEPYQYAEWRRARVAPDYHVEVQRHFYSVPSRLIRQVVEVRITQTTVEVFHRGVRVASHRRSAVPRRHTTIPEHMPSAHRRYAFWTPARLLAAAEKIGPSTAALCRIIMQAKPHPEQGFRSCLGILSLVRGYGPIRVEAACRRGIAIGTMSYRSVASILKNGLDKAFLPEVAAETDPIQHGNIRGGTYFH